MSAPPISITNPLLEPGPVSAPLELVRPSTVLPPDDDGPDWNDDEASAALALDQLIPPSEPYRFEREPVGVVAPSVGLEVRAILDVPPPAPPKRVTTIRPARRPLRFPSASKTRPARPAVQAPPEWFEDTASWG